MLVSLWQWPFKRMKEPIGHFPGNFCIFNKRGNKKWTKKKRLTGWLTTQFYVINRSLLLLLAFPRKGFEESITRITYKTSTRVEFHKEYFKLENLENMWDGILFFLIFVLFIWWRGINILIYTDSEKYKCIYYSSYNRERSQKSEFYL